jgi:membrane-associated phospholipid phosphatase
MGSYLPSCSLLAGLAVFGAMAPSAALADPPAASSSAAPFAPLPSAPLQSASPPPASAASSPSADAAVSSSATTAPAPATTPSSSPPRPADTLETGQHFSIDPVSDGVITLSGFGFAGILGLVLGTGEIRPTQPPLNAAMKPDDSILLSIDRGAVSQTFDKNANTLSDVGLYSAIGFTVLDTVLSGVRDGWDAGLVDAVMYAESISLTLTLTDITKIAVRRPRPFDYQNPDTVTTNSDLSFFSGHASTLGAITGTATYLAFVRSPHSVRPWITLLVGSALTAFVSYERVRGGDHFPTDVITGAMAGGAIGVLVPHLHRHKVEAPNVWIGASPVPGANGGTFSLQGLF